MVIKHVLCQDSILMVVGTGYQFLSLDENKPLPSCIDGKKGNLTSGTAIKTPVAVRPGKLWKIYDETDKKHFPIYFQMASHSIVIARVHQIASHILPTMIRGLPQEIFRK